MLNDIRVDVQIIRNGKTMESKVETIPGNLPVKDFENKDTKLNFRGENFHVTTEEVIYSIFLKRTLISYYFTIIFSRLYLGSWNPGTSMVLREGVVLTGH